MLLDVRRRAAAPHVHDTYFAVLAVHSCQAGSHTTTHFGLLRLVHGVQHTCKIRHRFVTHDVEKAGGNV